MRVVSKSEDDENYWKGEVDGKMGLFPKDFVKEVSLKTSKETESHQEATKTTSRSRKEIVDVSKEIYQVVYDYKAQNKDELTIKRDEVIATSRNIFKIDSNCV